MLAGYIKEKNRRGEDSKSLKIATRRLTENCVNAVETLTPAKQGFKAHW